MEAALDRFRAAGTQVLGVSVDSIHSHANWGRDLGDVSFPLLADFEPIGFLPVLFEAASALGTVGSNDSFGFGGTLGLDLVRLTVSRQHLLEWWPNPRPVDAIHDASLR